MAKLSIEITDSPYVVCSMHIMTASESKSLTFSTKGRISSRPFTQSVPPKKRERDVSWPCAPWRKSISAISLMRTRSGRTVPVMVAMLFLERNVWPSVWLQPSPDGRVDGGAHDHPTADEPGRQTLPHCRRFPIRLWKTNLAMIQPTIPGWKGECIGDDIAWMKMGPEDACTPSTQSPAFLEWRRALRISRTPWPWKRSRKTQSSRTVP